MVEAYAMFFPMTSFTLALKPRSFAVLGSWNAEQNKDEYNKYDHRVTKGMSNDDINASEKVYQYQLSENRSAFDLEMLPC